MLDYKDECQLLDFVEGLVKEANKTPEITINLNSAVDRWDAEEIMEIKKYQDKINKIIKLQNEKPELVIVRMKLEDLYGLDDDSLDNLIEYYEEV